MSLPEEHEGHEYTEHHETPRDDAPDAGTQRAEPTHTWECSNCDVWTDAVDLPTTCPNCGCGSVSLVLVEREPPPADAKEWTCPECGNDMLWCGHGVSAQPTQAPPEPAAEARKGCEHGILGFCTACDNCQRLADLGFKLAEARRQLALAQERATQAELTRDQFQATAKSLHVVVSDQVKQLEAARAALEKRASCVTCRHSREVDASRLFGSKLHLWCCCPTPSIPDDPGTLAPTFDRRVPEDYGCTLYARKDPDAQT